MSLSTEAISTIKNQMAGRIGKDAKRMAVLLAEEFGCDLGRIYHHSKDVRPKRKQRADSGSMKAMTPETFEQLAWYTVNTDHNARYLTEVAAANGLEVVSQSTFNRHLKRNQLDRRRLKKDMKPYMSWEANFPNHVHQIDSTVSQQFYIDDDQSIKFEPTLTHNKNKPGNRKPRLTLISLKDDFSRVIYARFTTSNTAFAWMNFLHQAWKEKEDKAGFPFFGLPRIIYTDNDVVTKSRRWINAMKLLDVIVISHEVGNSRAKGKVENSMRVLQEFEKATKIKKWRNLDEANAALEDYLYWINNRRHSVTQEIPFQRWMRIPKQRLNAVPSDDLFQTLHMDVIQRQIRRDMTISIKGVPWQLPFSETYYKHMGETVEVWSFPGAMDKIYLVLDGKEYEVTYRAKGMRGVGKYNPLPETRANQLKREIEEKPEPGLKLTNIFKNRHRKLYMPQEAQPFDESKIKPEINIENVMHSKLWFILQLQRRCGFGMPPTRAENAWIDHIFGQHKELPKAKLEQIIKGLETGSIQHPREDGQANNEG